MYTTGRVRGRVHGPCTQTFTGRVHGCVRALSDRVDGRVRAVYMARVYGPRQQRAVSARVYGAYTAL